MSYLKRIDGNFPVATMSEKSNVNGSRQNVFDAFDQIAEKMFDNFFDPTNQNSYRDIVKHSTYPKIDVFIKDGKYNVEASVPGLSPDNLNVEIKRISKVGGPYGAYDNVLEITGTSQTLSEGTEWIKRELKRSSFTKSFILPDNLEKVDEPNVLLKNGILNISWDMLKNEEKPKDTVKKITIRTD